MQIRNLLQTIKNSKEPPLEKLLTKCIIDNTKKKYGNLCGEVVALFLKYFLPVLKEKIKAFPHKLKEWLEFLKSLRAPSLTMA